MISKLRIDVPEACWIPTLYGVAYRDWSRNVAVCYPMPINWIVRLGRYLFFALRVPALSWWEEREAELYAKAERETKAYYEARFREALEHSRNNLKPE